MKSFAGFFKVWNVLIIILFLRVLFDIPFYTDGNCLTILKVFHSCLYSTTAAEKSAVCLIVPFLVVLIFF